MKHRPAFRNCALIGTGNDGSVRAQAGCPEPRISHQGYFVMEFPRLPPHVTLHVTPQVTPHVRLLLESFQPDTELDRPELMARLELKDRKNFMELYLRPALELGVIQMAYPDKPRSVSQKYRIMVDPKELP